MDCVVSPLGVSFSEFAGKEMKGFFHYCNIKNDVRQDGRILVNPIQDITSDWLPHLFRIPKEDGIFVTDIFKEIWDLGEFTGLIFDKHIDISFSHEVKICPASFSGYLKEKYNELKKEKKKEQQKKYRMKKKLLQK